MKVLLINGSPNEKGCTYTALNEVEKTLNKHNVETEILYLGKKPIAGCTACMACLKTGKCVKNDLATEVQGRMDTIDAIIIGSPVYYGAASGQLISFLNRLFFPIQDTPATEGKLGAAVVSCRRGGASSTFDQLNKYFTICNMPVVSSQYWNQVHGFTPEDVMKDEEGLQTLRTLGENMAWLLASIESGRKNGVPAPKYEEIVRTHFIR
ncbi:flavodoxin family protein [Clostridium sp. 19966]|uniref:flavodoxin family protein n=1 Tax=Clostridium sp. 19966 TaxID=2768166 RepID=UPI0028DEB2F8|nr:flavodoxin family protein [Clostridium sp. 19966]MDT8716954.1 flavodoxin family protein [Clostridium sp. 19966]